MNNLVFVVIIILLIVALSVYMVLDFKKVKAVESFTNYANNGLDKLDAVMYINLEDRTDRKPLVIKEIKKMMANPEKVHRISAVKIPKNGHKGCIQSHIIALRMAKMNNWDTVAIIEDDAELMIKPEEFNKRLTTAFDELNKKSVNWDVLLLSGLNKMIDEEESKKYKSVDKLSHATTSTIYIIKNSYLDKLIELFEYCNEKMVAEKWGTDDNHEPYALDQMWNKLISKDNWFSLKGDNIITQRDIKSSINNRI